MHTMITDYMKLELPETTNKIIWNIIKVGLENRPMCTYTTLVTKIIMSVHSEYDESYRSDVKIRLTLS